MEEKEGMEENREVAREGEFGSYLNSFHQNTLLFHLLLFQTVVIWDEDSDSLHHMKLDYLRNSRRSTLLQKSLSLIIFLALTS